MTGDLDDGNRVHDEGATMPESAEGRVVDIKKDGDIEISCPEGRDWPTGTKLSILDADGDAVVEVRVVDGDASVVTARYFVPWDAASSAASLIGAAIIPGVGGALGGALGRVIGAAGKRRGTGARIHEGMKVVEAPERTANPSPGPAPSPDEGGGCPPKPQSTGELRMVWARQRAVTANEHFSSGRAPARVEYSRYWRDARTGQIRPQLGSGGEGPRCLLALAELAGGDDQIGLVNADRSSWQTARK